MPDHADAVVSQVDAQTRMRALAAALAQLSPRDRDTLLLIAWGGLSQEETAAALNVPIGTVRSRLHRIRRLLRESVPDNAKEDSHD
jgi:RNA polymerase sigma-70 factor (ECF subfamily)